MLDQHEKNTLKSKMYCKRRRLVLIKKIRAKTSIAQKCALKSKPLVLRFTIKIGRVSLKTVFNCLILCKDNQRF